MNALTGRVALFIPSLAGGGAERVFVTLANGFAARGLAVDLVAANAKGVFRERVDPRVRVIDLRASRVIAALPGLASYLRREQPRALISGQTHANLIAVLARMLVGRPPRLILTEHHAVLSLDERGLNRRERVIRLLLPLVYPRANALVGVSSGVASGFAAAARFPKTRVHVIYNPVVIPDIQAMAQARPVHPWLAERSVPVILAVGRLTPAKDYETLLRAFALVRAAQHCRLVILGEGSERPRLEALIQELGVGADVSLPGFDPNPYAAMRSANVYVLSSLREGFAMVLVEVLACGAPVVATDCPYGPAEILDNGRYGRLVAVGDSRALAAAVQAALNQPHDPALGLRRAQDFSLDNALDGYLRLIAELGA